MPEKEPFVEPEPTPEEIEEARRLAEALEGKPGESADSEALAAARLLESLSENLDADEVARRRLRGALVAAAAKRSRPRTFRWIAAAASLFCAALLAVTLWRVWGPPRESALEAREREARMAVALISRTSSRDVSSLRSEMTYESAWQDRVAASLESSRFEALVQQAGGSASPAAYSGSRQMSGGDL